MAWTVIVATPVRKALRDAPERDRVKLLRALIGLEDDPRAGNVRKLAGEDELWRLRVGDWRILYRIEGQRLVVLVVRIGHRREVYR